MTDTQRSSRYLPEEWTLPLLTDENTPFFTSGELLIQTCAACGSVQHPPEELCRACQAMEFEYVAARPTGVVESFTVVHHAVHPLLKAVVPYNVVVVVLDEHPDVHIVGNVIDVAPGDVEIGMSVTATWAEVAATAEQPETMYLLQWSQAR